MDKLIINTPTTADYQGVIRAFIRAGFSVNRLAINNTLLIVEISSYQGVRVSNCDYAIITQSIYEIVTALGIDNVTVQHDDVTFTIADDCTAVENTLVATIDCVYDAVATVIVNRAKSIRADELAKCYAIVQAEQLAEDIAFNIHFKGCKKRIYQIDYTQYDALTLHNCLAQLGVTSHIVYNTRNLVIA